jgi:threonine dehydratase
VEAPSETQIADGLACRKPNAQAMEIIWQNVARIVEVTDGEIAAAMRALHEDTHNLVEGAGAAGVAAALTEQNLNSGKRIGIVVSGGNVDMGLYAQVLTGNL